MSDFAESRIVLIMPYLQKTNTTILANLYRSQNNRLALAVRIAHIARYDGKIKAKGEYKAKILICNYMAKLAILFEII